MLFQFIQKKKTLQTHLKMKSHFQDIALIRPRYLRYENR